MKLVQLLKFFWEKYIEWNFLCTREHVHSIPEAVCRKQNFSFFRKFWPIWKSFENPKGIWRSKLRAWNMKISNIKYEWWYNDIHEKLTLGTQLMAKIILVPFSTLYTLFFWTWMEYWVPFIVKILYFLLKIVALFFLKRVRKVQRMKIKLLVLLSCQKNFSTFMYPLYPFFRGIKTKKCWIFHIFR